MVNYAAVLQENNSELRFVASKYTFQVAGSMTNTLALSAQAGSSGQSTAMVIDSAGNVGIGTATPGYKFHVVGNSRIQGDLIVNGTQTIVDTNVATTERIDITNDGTGPALKVSQTGVGSGFPVADFYDTNISTSVPALRVADGGYVGIGTATPLSTLHVNGLITHTMPYIIIKTSLTGLSTAAQSGTVAFTTVENSAGGMTLVTNQIRIPTTGLYMIGASITMVTGSTVDLRYCYIRMNNVTTTTIINESSANIAYLTTTSYGTPTVQTIAYLSANTLINFTWSAPTAATARYDQDSARAFAYMITA